MARAASILASVTLGRAGISAFRASGAPSAQEISAGRINVLICPAPRPAATTASHASSTISSSLRVVRNHCGSSVPLLSDWLSASISLFSGAWQRQHRLKNTCGDDKTGLSTTAGCTRSHVNRNCSLLNPHVKWLMERRMIADDVDQWRAILSCIVEICVAVSHTRCQMQQGAGGNTGHSRVRISRTCRHVFLQMAP